MMFRSFALLLGALVSGCGGANPGQERETSEGERLTSSLPSSGGAQAVIERAILVAQRAIHCTRLGYAKSHCAIAGWLRRWIRMMGPADAENGASGAGTCGAGKRHRLDFRNFSCLRRPNNRSTKIPFFEKSL